MDANKYSFLLALDDPQQVLPACFLRALKERYSQKTRPFTEVDRIHSNSISTKKAHTYTHTRTQTHSLTHLGTQAHRHTQTQTQTYTCTHTYTHTRARAHARTHARAHARTQCLTMNIRVSIGKNPTSHVREDKYTLPRLAVHEAAQGNKIPQ